jgi:hypothetical protein
MRRLLLTYQSAFNKCINVTGDHFALVRIPLNPAKRWTTPPKYLQCMELYAVLVVYYELQTLACWPVLKGQLNAF